MKNVLILCTGNSCRSIMAEALVNAKLGDFVQAFSSGIAATGRVNPDAKKLLKRQELWRDDYYSKTIDELPDLPFDLVVTVCDHAKENCPVFPKVSARLHVSFEDPSGKAFNEYEKTLKQMQTLLLPQLQEQLGISN